MGLKSKRQPQGSAATQAPAYHERVKSEKRHAAVTAARQVFLQHGYRGASLQQIAKCAGLSTATLFKRFPTKASLFEALVLDFWNIDPGLPAVVQARDPSAGLHEIGAELAALCRRPDMVAFYRMFIAESQQFPEMGALMLDRGKSPTIGRISAYLNTQVTKGGLKSADTVGAAHQFMGMITDQLFWPVLLSPGYEVSDQAAEEIVAEAVLTLMARYGV